LATITFTAPRRAQASGAVRLAASSLKAFTVQRPKGGIQMKSCKAILPAAVLMTAALFTHAPDAAAQAKEGTWKATLLGLDHTQGRWVGNWLLFVYDENGTSDGDGIFDHTTWHCWGRGDFANGVGFTHGGCIGIDPTRDMAVINLPVRSTRWTRKS
jgi:hypothetical protein